MQQIKNLQYKIKQDLEFVMASEQKNIDEIAKAATIFKFIQNKCNNNI